MNRTKHFVERMQRINDRLSADCETVLVMDRNAAGYRMMWVDKEGGVKRDVGPRTNHYGMNLFLDGFEEGLDFIGQLVDGNHDSAVLLGVFLANYSVSGKGEPFVEFSDVPPPGGTDPDHVDPDGFEAS